MTKHALAFVVLLPSLAFAQTTSAGEKEKKKTNDPSRFPAVCSGFLESDHTRLVSVLGAYEGKHTGKVNFVAISPDGRRALSCSEQDQTVRLWDLAGAKERLKISSKQAYSAIFSADGRRAILGENGRVSVVDLLAGKDLKTFEATCRVSALARSDDGKTLLFGCENGEVHAVDIETGNAAGTLERRQGAVTGLAFAASGKRVFVGSAGGWIHLCDLDSGDTLRSLTIANGEGGAVAFSGDHKLALIAGRQRQGFLVDLATGETKAQLPSNVTDPFVLSEDGSLAIGVDADSVLVIDTATGRQQKKFRGTGRAVTSVALSRDAKVAVAGYEDGILRAWDLATAAPLVSGTTPGPVNALAVHGDLALVGGNDGAVRVWDTREGRLVHSLAGTEAAVADIAIAGSRVITLCAQGVARTWDLDSGELLRSFDPDEPGGVFEISRDAKFAILSYVNTSDEGTKSCGLAVRDLSGGGTVKSLEQQTSDMTFLALSPDGKLALAANADLTVGVWDVKRLKLLRSLPGHLTPTCALAFTPDGKRAWTASTSGTVKIWEVATGDLLRTFEAHAQSVSGIAFSPDGSLAVTSGMGGSVTLWDVAKVEPLDRISIATSEDTAFALAFPENGRFLVGTQRGVVLAFDVVK
ncbi:MAG TPA: WD40 repeat domain-containing protein [Planctomycetota bacterium]|nr:WD40 repeat domain-containing protein [Planctomycetota bacterium]